MSRDHRKLETFQLADRLVLDTYKITTSLPDIERYGLQSQLRRAAVSVATNIVEGNARRTDPEYCQFLNLAHASAREVSYLLGVCTRLGYLRDSTTAPLINSYDRVSAMLLRLIAANS
jgi:four helix bundle protein